MSLSVLTDDVIHMGEHTFMWIRVLAFQIEGEVDDIEVITALIGSEAFSETFTVTWMESDSVTKEVVHYNWATARIEPSMYERCDPRRAEVALQTWADLPLKQSPDAHERLRSIQRLMRSGTVYQFNAPDLPKEDGPGQFRDATYGANVGYCEFLVINRDDRRAHLIVAASD